MANYKVGHFFNKNNHKSDFHHALNLIKFDQRGQKYNMAGTNLEK